MGEALDQPNHVVAEVADGAGNQRRQAGEPDRPKTLDPFAQKRNGIALFPDDAIPAFENTGAIPIAKDFLRVRTSERVARDFFAALDAFQKKRVARALGDAQVSADGGEQVRRKDIIDGDEVSLFGEALEFAKVRLNHKSVHSRQFTVHSKGELIIAFLV